MFPAPETVRAFRQQFVELSRLRAVALAANDASAADLYEGMIEDLQRVQSEAGIPRHRAGDE